MEFHGEIKNGIFLLPKEQSELRKRYLASLKNGSRIKETLKKEGRAKSYKQVKAHFGLVVEMIRQRMIELGWDICGIAPNKLMIHEILKKACGGVGEMGETLGLSEMSITEESQFFENCRAWSATQLHLDIPDPDKNWREKNENNPSQSKNSDSRST